MSPGPVPKDADSSWATRSRRSSPSASRIGNPAPWTNDCSTELNWPEERRIGQNDIRGLPCPHLPRAKEGLTFQAEIPYRLGWSHNKTRISDPALGPTEPSHRGR